MELANLEQAQVPSASIQAVGGECDAPTDTEKWGMLTNLAVNIGYHLEIEEKDKFFSLLCYYADTFASSIFDLGWTDKLKYCSHTRNVVPIQQPLC